VFCLEASSEYSHEWSSSERERRQNGLARVETEWGVKAKRRAVGRAIVDNENAERETKSEVDRLRWNGKEWNEARGLKPKCQSFLIARRKQSTS
jgi:hypothetical protein